MIIARLADFAAATRPDAAEPVAPGSGLAAATPAYSKTTAAGIQAAADWLLIRRFAAGDEAAFANIANFYRPKIFSVVINLLHDAGDSEEVVQDTLLRAYSNLVRFRGEASLATWLYRIAINLARNRYWFFYRRSRHGTVSMNAPINGTDGATYSDLICLPAPDPADDHCQKDFAEIIATCIERLALPHREILNQRMIQGLSYGEIGASLGLNQGTVKSRLARARESLRAVFSRACPEFPPDNNPLSAFRPYRDDSRGAAA
jgi:RNA polymerase sigma-70 factor, ECF subfamily